MLRGTDTDGIPIVLKSLVVSSPIVKEAANVVERRRGLAKRSHDHSAT